MTFKADLAEDLRLILTSSEIDEAASYFPRDSVTSFACRVIRGDILTGAAGFDQGTEHTRTTQAVLLRSVIRSGTATLEGSARDPQRGDRIRFTEDDEATAEWYVAAVGAVDVGGGIAVQLEQNDYGNPGGQGSEQVR